MICSRSVACSSVFMSVCVCVSTIAQLTGGHYSTHDIGRDNKHAEATSLSNYITVQGQRRGGGSTHKHSNLGFRTESFREMFFLEAGGKYRGGAREEEKEGEERVRRRDELK